MFVCLDWADLFCPILVLIHIQKVGKGILQASTHTLRDPSVKSLLYTSRTTTNTPPKMRANVAGPPKCAVSGNQRQMWKLAIGPRDGTNSGTCQQFIAHAAYYSRTHMEADGDWRIQPWDDARCSNTQILWGDGRRLCCLAEQTLDYFLFFCCRGPSERLSPSISPTT